MLVAVVCRSALEDNIIVIIDEKAVWYVSLREHGLSLMV